MDSTVTPGKQARDRLLTNVKKEVKQIMEEAVTRKFVHEESSSIMALCSTVESCLQYGLKKRALGLFKNSTTSALLHKVSKNFEPAAIVVKMLTEVENNHENSKKSLDTNKNQSSQKTICKSKYLWIRLALVEKHLARIIDFLVQNWSKYYEKEALLADPVDGPILASLLVGPCALDYTKMKTADHLWTDPPADELVQRHRIHSGNHRLRSDSPKRPGLQVRRHTSSSSEESMRAVPLSAKDYVESLHQNSKSTLLYGKNNVLVQPVSGKSHDIQKDDVETLPGYLSLHQGPDGLSVKWTPNQLMNGCCEEDQSAIDRSLYWDYAVTIHMDDIVYLHCHQQPDSGGTIVLVGQDGVQHPPIHFPKGGHLLAFLSCLENGLLPHGQLDPPLWSQRGKALPGLGDEDEATDYVFRIISTFRPEDLTAELLDPKAKEKSSSSSSTGSGVSIHFPWMTRDKEKAEKEAENKVQATLQGKISPPAKPSAIQSYAKSQQQFNTSCIKKEGHRSAVKQLCDTMTRQILSRAFYGWLSYCRHLKTVRTHLSGLVNSTIIPVNEPRDASSGLTVDMWKEMSNTGMVKDDASIYRLVYYGGCAHEVRKEVWPYLLEHYKLGSLPEERDQLDNELKSQYENIMSEWLAVEAIVRQRDKEFIAANLVKQSQESQDGHIPLMRKDSSLSNDVFESMESDDFSHPETVPEESSSAVTPTTPTPVPSERASTSQKLFCEDDNCFSLKSNSFIQEQEQQSFVPTTSTDSKEMSTSSPDEGLGDSLAQRSSTSTAESKRSDSSDTDRNVDTLKSESDDNMEQKNIIITQATMQSVDVEEKHNVEEHGELSGIEEESEARKDSVSSGSQLDGKQEKNKLPSTSDAEEYLSASRESLVTPSSPVSNASNGGVYSRCDRNYWYFTPANLEKLRNVMCTYVWEHLDVGYVQGMCDLVAPLLVILDDESYLIFVTICPSFYINKLSRVSYNFQILDPELFEHMHQNGDYTHFYFCYRWFLLDFKRELIYDDVFSVWETIWTAKHISSPHFVLFIALALVEYYREIIIDNNMDFTDIIKFFNEMAERHNAKQVIRIARDLVYKLQDLIENK
ncbi:hypothetical protein LSH36_108g07045 [Paralvinella palmiformis]|uniref:Small G protein signaling modulator 1 n=1 Tax=Paralvinella palmiformis TaxID=53620 RepID=A0AAD9JZF8_9ANNE|nr:hypothetical protein LSH36_108g07045 [Paralvinella palmiformis]